MSSNIKCCGCWTALVNELSGGQKKGRVYRRAKYNMNREEYSIEFENLIEEEDFYAPPQHAISSTEKELLARGKYDELLRHQENLNRQQDDMLRQKEENAMLEDEAFIQAKKEAAKVSKQAREKQNLDKNKIPDINVFDTVEFSKWLSEENIDVTSPDFNIEDFDTFLEKMKAKSATALKEGKKNEVTWQQTMSRGLEATKIAESALNALQPVELHAVETESKMEPLNKALNTTVQVNTPRNIATNLSPYEAASNLSFALEKSDVSGFVDQPEEIKNSQINASSNQINANSDFLVNLEIEGINMKNGPKFEEPAPAPVVHNMETSFKLQNEVSSMPLAFDNSVIDVQINDAPAILNTSRVDTSLPKSTQQIPDRKDVTDGNDVSSNNQNIEVSVNMATVSNAGNKINKKDVANTIVNNDFPGKEDIKSTSSEFNDDFDDDFDDAFVSSDTTGGFEEMLV